MSEREKQNQGSLQNFANGRQDVADIEVLSFKVTAERENTVNADYRIKTKDKDGNGFIVRTFDGNVTFVKSSGTWKIDALSSRKTDEHRESLKKLLRKNFLQEIFYWKLGLGKKLFPTP